MLDDIGKAVAIVVGILTAAKLLKDLNKDNDNDKKENWVWELRLPLYKLILAWKTWKEKFTV